MHIEEIKNEDLEIHLKVQINSKDVEAKYSSEISSIVKKVKLNGFRAGKTPPSVVESMYGKSIYEEISHKLIEETVEKILKDRNITPSIQPKLEDLKNTKGENIEFTLKVEYLPNITLPDLKSIKLEKPSAKISEADLEKELNELAKNNPIYETKDDKSKKGDQVRIDFTGRINGEEFKGGKSQDFLLVLGSNSMIPGFEDQILKHKAGDEFTINVKFPDDYHSKDYAGKDAEFDIKLHEVLKATESSIDDDFAKKIFGLDSLETLKKNISQTMENNYNKQIYIISKMNLFDKLETILDFNIPQTLFKNEYDSIKHQTQHDESFKEETKDKSEKDLEKYYTKIANRRVKIALLISEYAKLHNISVSSEDLQQEIMTRASSMPREYAKAMMDFYSKNPQAAQELVGSILENKVIKNIIDNEITLVEKSLSKDEIDKLIDKENNKKLII